MCVFVYEVDIKFQFVCESESQCDRTLGSPIIWSSCCWLFLKCSKHSLHICMHVCIVLCLVMVDHNDRVLLLNINGYSLWFGISCLFIYLFCVVRKNGILLVFVPSKMVNLNCVVFFWIHFKRVLVWSIKWEITAAWWNRNDYKRNSWLKGKNECVWFSLVYSTVQTVIVE